MPASKPVVEREILVRHPAPAEIVRDADGTALPIGIAAARGGHRRGKRSGVRRGEPRDSIRRVLHHTATIGQHHRHTGRHRLERRNAEGLTGIRIDEDVAVRIARCQRVALEHATAVNPAGELPRRLRMQPPGQRAVAGDQQAVISVANLHQLAKHLDEQCDVLFRRQPSGMEQQDAGGIASRPLQQAAANDRAPPLTGIVV